MSTTPTAKDLLVRNATWAHEITTADPTYFTRLASEKQHPKVLWIGCADSRTSETTICKCTLGDIFTHRNIANMMGDADHNSGAVIEYAVDNLQVEDIVVVGHTKCGGVEAAWLMSRDPDFRAYTQLQRWLLPLVYLSKEFHFNEVPIEEKDKALRDLAEANVRRQVSLLSHSTTVRDARKRGQEVRLHAWIFEMETGVLVDVGAQFP
ncbi:putative carbonic anhydrase protein [Mycena epipterygia]|nr:putative carbonic anhydrase protein [Mycena epipterygia]